MFTCAPNGLKPLTISPLPAAHPLVGTSWIPVAAGIERDGHVSVCVSVCV